MDPFIAKESHGCQEDGDLKGRKLALEAANLLLFALADRIREQEKAYSGN
jgi:hypothetical protein